MWIRGSIKMIVEITKNNRVVCRLTYEISSNIDKLTWKGSEFWFRRSINDSNLCFWVNDIVSQSE